MNIIRAIVRHCLICCSWLGAFFGVACGDAAGTAVEGIGYSPNLKEVKVCDAFILVRALDLLVDPRTRGSDAHVWRWLPQSCWRSVHR